nr:hypothetical protein QSJ49_09945 [Halobacterium salinarum]
MQQHRANSVNWRRTDSGVELYDETNPDAWIHVDVDPGAPADERPYSVCPDCGVVAPPAHRPHRPHGVWRVWRRVRQRRAPR